MQTFYRKEEKENNTLELYKKVLEEMIPMIGVQYNTISFTKQNSIFSLSE